MSNHNVNFGLNVASVPLNLPKQPSPRQPSPRQPSPEQPLPLFPQMAYPDLIETHSSLESLKLGSTRSLDSQTPPRKYMMSDQQLPTIDAPLRSYKGTTIFECTEIDEIERMEIRKDDIWVLSFPRSGTTLTQEIVYSIMSDLNFEDADRIPLDARFPFLDMNMEGMSNFQGIQRIKNAPSPRLIKSHLHRHILPPKLFTSGCKIIYIMRNPKDVLVSNMQLVKFLKQTNPDQSIAEYQQNWLQGDQAYAAPWWRHVRDFWLNRKADDILLLTYEDLVQNMEENIRRVTAYLDKTLTDTQVQKIRGHCQFDRMKSSAASNALWMTEKNSVDGRFGGHIRKGKVGGWRDYMTTELSDQLDVMVEENLGDLGLHFDYGQ